MRRLLLLISIGCFFEAGFAQWHCRVYMTEKDSLDPDFSESALQRRSKYAIAIDETDKMPVERHLNELATYGTPLFLSRWLNMQSLECAEDKSSELQQLPFVSFAECRAYQSAPKESKLEAEQRQIQDGYAPEMLNQQTAHMGSEEFGKRGLNGKGICIAVLDIGFKHADQAPELKHLKIRDQKDFISRRSRVYRKFDHGTKVLSCIGGMYQGIPLGLATEAEILLAKTERSGEYLIEEESWLAAVEWADLKGADIIHSSLGYTWQRYWTYQMDGKTTLVSKAAAMASAKGMLVVVSAGNEGELEWRIISAPADSDSVLAVGAIDPQTGLQAAFSSFGPTADKRLKPDVMAFGSCIVPTDNGLTISEGTSFAAPLVSGFAACLLQHNPQLTPFELRKLIRESGHLYPYFDYSHGFGIPQADHFFNPPQFGTSDSFLRLHQTKTHTTFECRMPETDTGQFDPEDPSNFLYYHLANAKGELLCYRIIMPHRATYDNGKVIYESIDPQKLSNWDVFNALRLNHGDFPESCTLRARYLNEYVEIKINEL